MWGLRSSFFIELRNPYGHTSSIIGKQPCYLRSRPYIIPALGVTAGHRAAESARTDRIAPKVQGFCRETMVR